MVPGAIAPPVPAAPASAGVCVALGLDVVRPTSPREPMLKLTRLNHHVFAVNPDAILWVDAAPDTMLTMADGQKLLVRESLDEVVLAFIEQRALAGAFGRTIARPTGDSDHGVASRHDDRERAPHEPGASSVRAR